MTAREEGRALKDGDQFDAGPGYRWQFLGRTKTAGYCWLLDLQLKRFFLCQTRVATSHATLSAEGRPAEFADGDLQTWKAAVKGGRGVEPETVAYGTVSDIPTERVNPAPVIDPWLIPTATRKEAPMAANKGVPLAERVPPTCPAQAGPPAIWCSRDEGHRPAAAHRFDKSTPPDGYKPRLADQRPDLLARWVAEHPHDTVDPSWIMPVTEYARSIKGTEAGKALWDTSQRIIGEDVESAPVEDNFPGYTAQPGEPVDSEGAPLTGPEPILEPATEDEGAPLVDPGTEPLDADEKFDRDFESYRDAQTDRFLGGPSETDTDGVTHWAVGASEHDLIERAAQIDAVIKQGKAELDEIKAKLRSMLTPGTHASSHGQAVIKEPTRTFKIDRGPKLSDAALARISEPKVSPKLARDVMPPEVYDQFVEVGSSAVELSYTMPTEDENTTTDAEGFTWLA